MKRVRSLLLAGVAGLVLATGASAASGYHLLKSVTLGGDTFWDAITYDAANRKTGMADPLGHTASYAHDANGQLTSTTDRDGPTAPDSRAAATSRSSSALTLRAPAAPVRPFNQVRLSASSVTEIACLGIVSLYDIV